MPKPYPKEFRDDVVRVAQQGESGVTLKQVAKDFGISESCLTNWIAVADREAGPDLARPLPSPPSCASSSAATGCWGRRTRSCAARPRICRRRTSAPK